MTAVAPQTAADWFGAGGGEPWAAALGQDRPDLWLVRDGARDERLQVGRWTAAPDAVDRTLLQGLDGPLLDIGCGPGRMVRAALDAGLPATGIDVARAAVDRCRADGLPVLHRSVFDPLPGEGRWATLLLLDGNVGIGGDVARLLARCRDLLAPGGILIAETHADPDRDEAYAGTVIDAAGAASETFPWAEVGERPLIEAADGFTVDGGRALGGRRFVRLRRSFIS